MALPPLFHTQNLTTIPFRRSDGVSRPDVNIVEPGLFVDDSRNEVVNAHFPELTQVTDYLITGTFVSTATWTLTVTPLTTQSGGSAAAHGMGAETVSFVAVAKTAAEVIQGLVTAVSTAGTALTPSAASSWNRIASYVTAAVSSASTSKIRLTARSSGATFSAVLTSDFAGDSYTTTVITAPQSDLPKVGFYVAVDTSQGTDGYDKQGKAYIKKIASTTPAAEIIGPVYLGADTKEVASGFAYREYEPGNVPLVKYGHVAAYGDSVIALAGGPEPVYVRHTAAGDYLPGMATDATGAAAAATANVWTGTPTVTNSVLYTMTIVFGLNTAQLTYTSDGTAVDTEIVAGLKVELLKYNTSVGQPLYGITATGTTTLILTGPADGRGFTPATPATSAGVITWVETTPEVSTHTLLTRGDKFIAPSTRIGSVKVDVPIA